LFRVRVRVRVWVKFKVAETPLGFKECVPGMLEHHSCGLASTYLTNEP